ncbi:MAG TPA: ABC transporter substrate-binding protein [Candidatus Dormibacteraeota bacterium]|nr:ABC transporter substrate-binding protein [Candidatus Dormibacteraeota bacterium]
MGARRGPPRWWAIWALALLLSACGAGAGGGGQSGSSGGKLSTVVVGLVSTNTADWPVFLAEAHGFFRQHGIAVQEVITGGPAQSADQLATGAVDLASDGTDSWIRAVAQHLPVTIVAPEFITDPYSLITVPSISSWNDLKGRKVILGTTTDVTAISFSAMARAHGLSQSDFTVITAGSTNARYAALQSGNVDAAMLTQPFDILAESQGMHVLATSKQYVPKWIFTTIGVNTSWARDHRSQIVAFLKALEQGIAYGYAHPDDAIAIMAKRSKVPTAEVKKAYDLDFTQWHAFSKTLSIPQDSLQTVVGAVVQQGTVRQAPASSALYDASYVRQANAG